MKEIKTILSDEIMNLISDMMEKELSDKGVFYIREGTKFTVRETDKLIEAQLNATRELISRGVITEGMLLADLEANFGK